MLATLALLAAAALPSTYTADTGWQDLDPTEPPYLVPTYQWSIHPPPLGATTADLCLTMETDMWIRATLAANAPGPVTFWFSCSVHFDQWDTKYAFNDVFPGNGGSGGFGTTTPMQPGTEMIFHLIDSQGPLCINGTAASLFADGTMHGMCAAYYPTAGTINGVPVPNPLDPPSWEGPYGLKVQVIGYNGGSVSEAACAMEPLHFQSFGRAHGTVTYN